MPQTMGLESEQAGVTVYDSPSATDSHISLLQAHLPKSLSLLRRLQLAGAGRGPTSHVLFTTSGDPDGGDGAAGRHFAAAYVDVFKAPETQVWIYSTVEDSAPDDGGEAGALPGGPTVDRCVGQVLAVLRRVRDIAREAAAGGGARPPVGIDGVVHHDSFMVGALHETVRRLLLARGVKTIYCNPHYKFLFRVRDLPGPSSLRRLGSDMRWDTIKKEDVPLIVSRTNIPKTESTLMALPSLGVRLSDGTLIAWSFLGLDGTLSTLHCQEPFRGRGLAKAMATKLIKDHNNEFGSDGFCAADVHINNTQSQAVCRSIGGQKGWRTSWSIIANDSL